MPQHDENYFKGLVENNYITLLTDTTLLREFLLNSDINKNLKKQFLSKFNPKDLETIIQNIMINHSWVENVILLNALQTQVDHIRINFIKLATNIKNEYSEKLIAKQISPGDFEQAFKTPWVNSTINSLIVQETGNILDNNRINPNVKLDIFKLADAGIFKKITTEFINTVDYKDAYGSYLAFLINNFANESKDLKSAEYSEIINFITYEFSNSNIGKINWQNFHQKETENAFIKSGYDNVYEVWKTKTFTKTLNDPHLINTKNQFFDLMVKGNEKFFHEIPNIIFSEKQKVTSEPMADVQRTTLTKVVYNNEQYLDKDPVNTSQKTFHKGHPLFLDSQKNTPIGYNIHLPFTNNIKGIVVEVYGGLQAKDKLTDANSPDNLNNFDNYLLNQNCAVIKLNLPDLIKLDVNQALISQDLHHEIQKAINQFYQTIKNSPESLHPDLKNLNLQDKKIFLYGASFGGATTLRQAELYPHTFDGYISHNGYIDLDMAQKSDLFYRQKYNTWLNPANIDEISKISEPMLLMHSRDDNNVNIKVTLDFYNKLTPLQQSNLTRICVTPAGNPMPSSSKLHNKGHFLPTTVQDFTRYMETVLNFVNYGPSILPQVTEWRAYQEEKIANKFYRAATVQEQFIAEALALDSKKNSLVDQTLTGEEQEYKALFYAIAYPQELIQNNERLNDEIKRLKNDALLTDETIIKLLKSQSNIFSQFIEEYYGIHIKNEYEFQELIADKKIVGDMRSLIEKLSYKNKSIARFWLTSLYQANPNLLMPLYPAFEQDRKMQETLSQATTQLASTVKTQKEMIREIWKETAKNVIESQNILLENALDLLKSVEKNPSKNFTQVYRDIAKACSLCNKNDNHKSKIHHQFYHLIKHLESIVPQDNIVVMNIIMAKLVNAQLFFSLKVLLKTLDEASELYLKINFPDASSENRKAAQKFIENEYILLKLSLQNSLEHPPTMFQILNEKKSKQAQLQKDDNPSPLIFLHQKNIEPNNPLPLIKKSMKEDDDIEIAKLDDQDVAVFPETTPSRKPNPK